MDLNPDAPKYLDSSVKFLEQDCSSPWQVESDSLNVVFTCNFFEHPLTETSLGEGLSNRGFKIDQSISKFLPYTMVKSREYPELLLKLTLIFPSPGGFLESNFWLSRE